MLRNNKIVIVAHNLRYGGGLSVGKNLINSIITNFPNNQYLLVIPENLGYEQDLIHYNNIQLLFFKSSKNIFNRIYFDRFTLRENINKFKAEFVLCLGNFSVYGIEIPQAVLLHNPFMCFPEIRFKHLIGLFEKIYIRIQKYLFRQSLKHIKLLYCQTETMASHVRTTFNYDGQIKILPNVISSSLESKVDIFNANPNLVNKIQNINNKILFCLTSYYPHKNLELLISLLRNYGDELSEYTFIITIDKSQGIKAIKLLDSIIENGLSKKIINIGPVKQEELSWIYNKSYALFLPTLLESFSGTYIEAMKFKTPILTTNFDFAIEVCKDAAVYFDPNDLKDIVNKIHFLNNNRHLIIQNGIHRFKDFNQNWNSISAQTMSEITYFINKYKI
jgi:glycosyltransferase involved in cell wall biosynthesis